MRRPLSFSILALVLASIALPPGDAWAARKKKKTEATQTTSKPAKVKIKRQRSSSAETKAERDRRLLRECKGLPNAGACLGYAN
ncbi:hypothetical protein GCM10027276_42410 [Comamonas piscis]